jgi:N-acetylglucosamine malate deacetylase 1
MRVLAVGAHPDDLEISVGGTLAKYVSLGHEVIMCYMAKGNLGHTVIPPDELAGIRQEEATKAAAVIGAKAMFLEYNDLEITHDVPTQRRLAEIVRQTRPDVALTHSPDDYLIDHVRTSHLVFDATFISGVPHVKTESPAHPGVTPIYHMDTEAGIGFMPTEWVDVSDFLKLKLEMMSQHKSQLQWLKEHDNVDMLDFIEVVAKYRGFQAGVKYAEAFRRVDKWPRATTGRLLP